MSESSKYTEGLSPLKQAFIALEEAEANLEALKRSRSEPIAVIGIGCRFPGNATGPDLFWRNLRGGHDAITEVPFDRWDIERYYDPNPEAPGKMSTRWGGFIEEVDRFDVNLFDITPREARSMDPQQRILMEVAWEALEDAGHASLRSLEGSSTGVFIGIATDDYAQLQMEVKGLEGIDTYFASGVAHSIASGRLSYQFGLQGPAVSLDTACSSSLVAVRQACQSLLDGECHMALAGGVNLILSPTNTVALSKYQMMAPDGRCKTFDAAADGFVRGEGCGVVVLKRLKDAEADHDHIYALILGSAINQDGPSSGLTAPNGPSQEAVIRAALKRARSKPAQVGYVEAHGTGTSLGDPIEVQALGAVLGEGRPKENPLMIGSVKTNIGHLEAASGIAALIKVVLALQHKQIPPHLHFRSPNPHIPWERLPIVVPTELTPWPVVNGKRIAGVSSFGFSGTNAHVILEEAPAIEVMEAEVERPLHILGLSAKSEVALKELAGRYERHLREHSSLRLPDVCFTANAGRSHFNHRFATVAQSLEQMREQLAAFAAEKEQTGVLSGRVQGTDRPKVAFLFTGQGSQYVGMGQELLDTQPTFRKALERCDELLRPYLERPLLSVLYPEAGQSSPLDETAYTQPALFALEYALAELWRSWGIEPSVVMGHSVGEYVAACVAGVFSLEDGLRLIATRARLMQQLPGGGKMAAVFADEAQVAAAIAPYAGSVSIAALNGPENTVISGVGADVEVVLKRFETEGIGFTPLTVSHAFHSPLMEPMLDEFEKVALGVTYSSPRIGVVSNVSGALARGEEMANGAYWRRHVRQPVRFCSSMEWLYGQGYRMFMEIGPSPVLLGMGGRFLPVGECVWLPSLKRGEGDWRRILTSLADLYVRRVEVDWAGFDHDYSRRKMSLPTYPFQRRQYWFTLDKPVSAKRSPISEPSSPKKSHPLLGSRIDSATGCILFRSRVGCGETAFFKEHRVSGSSSLPIAAVLEAAMAAANQLAKGRHGAPRLEMVSMDRVIDLRDDNGVELEWALDPNPDSSYRFRLFCRSGKEKAGEGWHQHAAGTMRLDGGGEQKALPNTPLKFHDTIRGRCPQRIDADEFYRGFALTGLDFGPAFRTIETVWVGKGEAMGLLLREEGAWLEEIGFGFSPLLLDGALQVIAAAMRGGEAANDRHRLYLPVGIDRVQLESYAGGALWGYAILREPLNPSSPSVTGDVSLTDENGRQVAMLSGCRLLPVEAVGLGFHQEPAAEPLLYRIQWETRPNRQYASSYPMAASGFVASLQQMLDKVEAEAPAVAEAHHLDQFDRATPVLDELVSLYIMRALEKLGWQPVLGEHVQRSMLASKLGVVEQYHRLLDRFLSLLAEDGYLTSAGPGYKVLQPFKKADPASIGRASIRSGDPATIELDLIHRCGSRLAEVLRGESDPVDLLFTGEAFTSVTRLYTESVTARVFNTLAKECVAEWLRSWPQGRPLRVLEIGAGTGGTTQFMLEALQGYNASYLFTDISPVFVRAAKERYGDRVGFTGQTLDIERDPKEQGLAEERFNLVVAANVLHATTDLRDTLRHVQAVTGPAGLLVLVEVTTPQRWIDLTFGLTSGWWKFADAPLREGYPLLSVEQWKILLGESGFQDAVAVPDPGHKGSNRGLHLGAVIVASRAPGPRSSAIDLTGKDSAAQQWLILKDDGGLGERLQERLREKTIFTTAIGRDQAYATEQEPYVHKTFKKKEDFDSFFADLAEKNGSSFSKVLFLWGLDRPRDLVDDATDPLTFQEALLSPLLALFQSLVDAPVKPLPQVILVTRAAMAATGREEVDANGATLWGMVRGIVLEHPEFRCKLIDIEADGSSEEITQLLAECEATDREDQVVIRGEKCYVPRLEPLSEVAVTAPPAYRGAPQRLDITARGLLENLFWQDIAEQTPGPGEVKISVQATGLNFRDILSALGVYADGPVPFGSECAGIVTEIGQHVEHLQPGDRVLAIAAHSFSSEVIAHSQLVFRIPEGMEFERAAGLPVAYTTAAYALEGLARVRKGQRILIHAAAGGVGLAAVQLARFVGAEIYATAGSPEKQQYLRRLGVMQVMNSRDLDFADSILSKTRGEGVSVVLNSLAGDFIARSMGVVAKGGVFLELGRSAIWTAEEVARRRPDVAYHPIDLTEDMSRRPEKVRPIMEGVLERIKNGTLPPLPCRVFPKEAVIDAFRYMSRARQIGKIVLRWPDRKDLKGGTLPVHPDGTYWITGGMGALGLFTADWLAKKGAGHIVLTGRHVPLPEASEKIEEIRRRGTRISVMTSDIASRDEVDRVMKFITGEVPPLRGIIHAAGALDDGVLQHQSWERFETAMRPKVSGTWHLHQATRHLALDFWVLYSSAAALLGAAGQINHSAACAYMDALAHMRRTTGLRAISINWGAWAKAGAAVQEAAAARASLKGIGHFSPETALQMLEALIRSEIVQAAVSSVDWHQYILQTHPDGMIPPMLERLVPAGRPLEERLGARGAQKPGLLNRIQMAPASQRKQILSSFVHDETLRILGLDASDDIDPEKPLNDIGLDSLMAVELRNALGLALGRSLSATLLFDYPTVNAVTDYLAAELHLQPDEGLPSVIPSGSAGASTEDLLSRIEVMKDEDIDQLINEREGKW